MALQDQLNQATQSIGKIVKEPGREGGDDRFFTESGAWAEKVGNNRYRVAILGNIDANGTPGRGAYMVEVDGNGNVVRQPYYQPTTNNDWTGLAAFVLTAAGGMMASGAFGGAAAGGVGASDLAGIGLGGGVTTGEAALGSYVLPATSAAAISAATGIPVATLTAPGALAALAKSAPAVLSGIKSLLPPEIQGSIGSLLAGGIGLAGAYSAIDSLKNQGTVAQNAYNDLGTGMFNDYNALGQNILGLYSGAGDYLKGEYGKLGTDTRGQFSALGSIAETKRTNLGAEGKGLFDILGQDTYDKYAGLAGKYGEKYLNVANDIKNNFTDFTPWSLKTTIGSSDGKNYTLNPDQQAVVDNSTQTASGAFGAADSLDLANLRNQEYNLMEQTYAPKDEADRVALENRMRAQGRLGLNYGTYGSTPEQIALEEAIKRRNLQSYLTADDNAMKRYQGLISSGVSAAGVPLQYDTQGLKTLQSGVDFGNTQFGNELRGTQTWADQANKAIGAEQGLETTGLQGMLSNRNQGINFYTGQKAHGIGENIGQSAHGIDLYNQNLGQGLSTQSNFAQRGIQAAGDYADKGLAGKYQNMAKGIAAKLGSEQKALEALIKLYNGITGMNLTSSAAGGNPANVIAGITKALKDQGVSDNVIEEYILNNTDPMNTGGIFEPNYSSEDLMSMFQ